MKKNILIVVTLLSSLTLCGQVRWGVKAGFSGGNMRLKDQTQMTLFHDRMLAAYHAGVLTDIPLAKSFAVQPALLYSVKGTKTIDAFTTGMGNNEEATTRYRYNYLELPVNFLYKGEAGRGKVFAGLGPYVAYGIGGKVTYKGYSAGTKKSRQIKFDGEDNTSNLEELHANAIDAGVNLLAGYEFKNGLLFSINYTSGFLDVSASDRTLEKHRYFGVSVGYLFTRK